MTISSSLIEHVLAETDHILESDQDLDQKLGFVSQLLQDAIPHYNWVGFYLVNESGRELELGPYVGASTDHTLIPFGKGVCGQVAEARETFVIQDVNAEDNYLACSLDVKSEIVVPILRNGEFLGELDIDSHANSPFTPEDSIMLEQICQRLAEQF